MRKPQSHKGDHGRVLILAGSEAYVGAAYLCGEAALRAGADLAIIAAPERVAWTLNAMSADLITIKLPDEKRLQEEISRADCLLIGPGLTEESDALAKRLLKEKTPKVVDARAIGLLPLAELKNALLTPHSREFERLLTKEYRDEQGLQELLKSNVILRKGSTDTILSEDSVETIETGNPGMTIGGTGDVLAGICAALIAQGHPLREAAVRAARINGAAGDEALADHGYGFTASDLLAYILVDE